MVYLNQNDHLVALDTSGTGDFTAKKHIEIPANQGHIMDFKLFENGQKMVILTSNGFLAIYNTHNKSMVSKLIALELKNDMKAMSLSLCSNGTNLVVYSSNDLQIGNDQKDSELRWFKILDNQTLTQVASKQFKNRKLF